MAFSQTLIKSNVLSEVEELMKFYVYFLRDSENKLYIGQTNSLRRREGEQITKSHKAAKFVKDGRTFNLVHFEVYSSRVEAMRREKHLKGWTRTKKEALIAGDLELLKSL